MDRLLKIFFVWVAALLLFAMCSCKDETTGSGQSEIDWRIVNRYQHDSLAFTQGLAFSDGYFYESTGKYGTSGLRKALVKSGEIVQERKLASNRFGEGVAIVGDEIFQLTWKSGIAFVYDKESFELLRQFDYAGQGWGLTFDGENLIMSDGTDKLYFVDPASFERVGSVSVTDQGKAVRDINELEYVKGMIFANLWKEAKIAVIDPADGKVAGWIDLSQIVEENGWGKKGDVLNGIAYNQESDRLFVTGKYWDVMFEIEKGN